MIFYWELDFVLGNFPFLKLKALTSGTEDYITAWKKLQDVAAIELIKVLERQSTIYSANFLNSYLESNSITN